MASILLIEDNRHIRSIFSHALTARGHHLRVAEDGERGLTLLRDHVPDLVVLDLSLPKIDGWTVTRTIRSDQDPHCSRVPILALTGHAMKGDRERAIAAGCNAYVAKPVSPRELGRRIDALVGAGP